MSLVKETQDSLIVGFYIYYKIKLLDKSKNHNIGEIS